MWYLILAAALLAGLAAFMRLPYTVDVQFVFEAQPPSLDINIKSKLSQFNSNHHLQAEELGKAILTAGAGNSSPAKRFLMSQFLKQLGVQKVTWRSWLGLDDAMLTAIGSGALWALKGAVINYLSRVSVIRAFQLEVNPDFCAFRCSSQLDCIFKIRLVHYIYIITWMRFKAKGE
ncbi:MAG TPA: hypothetical protein DER60_11540 [Syntrophomonas sp.]|jgi:hypothetical protein|nr:hypothetical protein [Syntrophomonas sp.]